MNIEDAVIDGNEEEEDDDDDTGNLYFCVGGIKYKLKQYIFEETQKERIKVFYPLLYLKEKLLFSFF